MVFNLFKSRNYNSDDCVLALDIGTKEIKAIIATTEEKDKINIIGFAQTNQTLGLLSNDITNNVTELVNKCRTVIKRAEKDAGVSPEKMIIGFGSAVIKNTSKVLKFSRSNSSQKLQYEELKDIINKLERIAFEKSRKELAQELGTLDIDLKLVGADVNKFVLDKYNLANPIGFHGKNIEVNLFNTFATEGDLAVFNTLAAELKKEIVKICSETYAMSHCIKNTHNYLIIDIGATTTDLAFISNGINIKNDSFNIGGNTFTKRIAYDLKVSFEEAENIKFAYADDSLERHSHSIIRKALDNDTQIWLSGITISMSELDKKYLPDTIYLSGGGSYLPEIMEALENKKWQKSLNINNNIDINFLRPNNLNGISSNKYKFERLQDVPVLSLTKEAFKYLNDKNLLVKALKQSIKLIQ